MAMMAATGAKNGASWPSTHLATAHAAATAIAACSGTRQLDRTRSQRVAIDTRDRLAASSNMPSGITAPACRQGIPASGLELAPILHEVEPEQRLRDARPRIAHPSRS